MPNFPNRGGIASRDRLAHAVPSSRHSNAENDDLALPMNLQAERAVLGSVVLDNRVAAQAMQALAAGDFFLPEHRAIFTSMLRLAEKQQPIDTVTLMDDLAGHGELERAGGAAYLAQLADGLPRTSNIARYAAIVREKSELRGLAHAGEAIREAALRGDREMALAHTAAIREAPASEEALRAIAIEDLLAEEIRPREMLLDPVLPEQGLAMLYAYRGIGKTYLALGMAAAVASGAKFLRWQAPRPRRVLFVDGELPAATIRERAAMTIAGFGDARLAPGALRIVTPDLQERPMPDLGTVKGQRLIEPHLEGVDLLVIDNLSSLCRSGNENEGEGWLPVQEWALGLRRRGMSVLFVHHAGKNKSQRGTSRREDLLDTVITLRHPSDYSPEDGLRAEVHFEKTRSLLGEAARPFEVMMSNGANREAVWTFREMEDVMADRAATLFSVNMSVRDVANALGISRSHAGRLRQAWSGEDTRNRGTVPASQPLPWDAGTLAENFS
jgi:putative DNA primase/helicase